MMLSSMKSLVAMAVLAWTVAAAAAAAAGSNSVGNSPCDALTEPIWKETTGSDNYPYMDAMVQITSQDVDAVTFNVQQLWNKAGVPMVAVHYRDLGSGEDMCTMNAPQEDGTSRLIPYDSVDAITAHCTHGYADVGVYVYVGPADDFNVDECEACTAPDQNYVGYYLALPCVPVCTPGTPDCFTGPTVTLADVEHESTCLYDETPIVVTATKELHDKVEFTVQNTWPDDAVSALSVHYIDFEGQVHCDTFDDMTGFQSTSKLEARCENGLATVGIHIYSKTIQFMSSIKPEDCTAPRDTDLGQCSYEFVVPCSTEEVCITDDEETLPPVVGEPLDCVEFSTPLTQEIVGNQNELNLDGVEALPPVTIIAQTVDTVTVTVAQVFNPDGLPMMAVGYRAAESNEFQCEMETNREFQFQMELTAQCTMGYAEIVLYLYVGAEQDFDVDDCEACTVPNEEQYAAIYYVVPCTPVCRPEVPDCLEGPLVTLADIEHETAVCLYESTPVMINTQALTTDRVEFTIDNTWPTGSDISSLSVSYLDERSGELQCTRFEYDAANTFRTSKTIVAVCDEGMASVVVEIHSAKIGYHAEQITPNACAAASSTSTSNNSEIGTCAYEFIVPCGPMIACGATGTIPPTSFPTLLTDAPTTMRKYYTQ